MFELQEGPDRDMIDDIISRVSSAALVSYLSNDNLLRQSENHFVIIAKAR